MKYSKRKVLTKLSKWEKRQICPTNQCSPLHSELDNPCGMLCCQNHLNLFHHSRYWWLVTFQFFRGLLSNEALHALYHVLQRRSKLQQKYKWSLSVETRPNIYNGHTQRVTSSNLDTSTKWTFFFCYCKVSSLTVVKLFQRPLFWGSGCRS